MDIGRRRADPILTHRANEHNHVLDDACVEERERERERATERIICTVTRTNDKLVHAPASILKTHVILYTAASSSPKYTMKGKPNNISHRCPDNTDP